jgi:magnesium chelatase subunit I
VLLAFTANPEDYTARGKIITPLKDRIGSEIITHYPVTVDLAMAITAQEAWTRRAALPVRVPELVAEVAERVAFEARQEKRIDQRSGVSQRLSITLLENIVSNAERRAVRLGEPEVMPRIADIYAAMPAITGKIELEYEGELVGGAAIARELIRRAADATFRERDESLPLDDIVMWFDTGSALQVSDDAGTIAAREGFATVPGLVEQVVASSLPSGTDAETVVSCELVLEALVARRKLTRSEGGQYGRSARRKGGMPPEHPEREQ